MTLSLDAHREPGDVPFLRMPTGPEHFRRRAARLGTLARGHAAGDFLAFLAELAAAQAQAWDRVRIPGSAIAVRASPTSSVWREALPALLAGLDLAPAPAAARAAIARLRRLSVSELEALALRVLVGELPEEDVGLAPFVGAALQVVHTIIATRIPPASVPRSRDGGCPVCGSPPVAG